VSGLSDVIAVSAGGEFTCAVESSGAVVCWGASDVGELGHGSGFGPRDGDLVEVAGLPVDPAMSVTAGDAHACAVTDTGELYCWGWNLLGQLGQDCGYYYCSIPGRVDLGIRSNCLVDVAR
jgi:alpha-tubulin suppressor-like RCC1 family protein